MSECNLDMGLELENVEEVKAALDSFRPEMKMALYQGLEKIASKKEKELKSSSGWTDQTGKFRRSLFVAPTFEPLGLEFGSFASYGYWVAHAHGTWLPSWWDEWIEKCALQLTDELERVLDRVTKQFNNRHGGETK